jgi:hypothetical protein
MKLRDHPLAAYENLPTWPPRWVRIDETASTTLSGDERGFLIHVRIFDVSEGRLALRMRHDQAEYLAHLMFDDPDFCQRVFEVLKGRIGSTIKDIGDIEFD